MNKRPSSFIAALSSCVILLSACGGDSPTGNSGDALTPAEAEYLTASLFDLLQNVELPEDFFGPAPSSPARVPYGDLFDDEIDVLDECFLGGTATLVGLITGDVDQTAETVDVDINATGDFSQCVEPIGEVTTITLNGDPDVDMSADLTGSSETGINVDILVEGAVTFSTSDGRSGVCAVDVNVDFTLSNLGQSEVLSGSMCGADAGDFEISLFDDTPPS